MQSQTLTNFYRAYLAWVEAGAPEKNEHEFKRRIGLCSNLHWFTFPNDFPLEEMTRQFAAAGLDSFHPFSRSIEYRDEKVAGTCHLNNNRMSWVREHAQLPQSFPCWSCKQPATMAQRADADGDCPHCKAELDIESWPFS